MVSGREAFSRWMLRSPVTSSWELNVEKTPMREQNSVKKAALRGTEPARLRARTVSGSLDVAQDKSRDSREGVSI